MVYTTHSPFLVPADNILSVRTVEDVVIERPGEMIQVLGTKVGDRVVTTTNWFDEAGLLRLQLGEELRVQVRPSGTEPKVKLYGEGIGIDPAPYLEALANLLI